jgi:hypothetical protein
MKKKVPNQENHDPHAQKKPIISRLATSMGEGGTPEWRALGMRKIK